MGSIPRSDNFRVERSTSPSIRLSRLIRRTKRFSREEDREGERDPGEIQEKEIEERPKREREGGGKDNQGIEVTMKNRVAG